MSTYFYITCLDHDPPLVARDESGQHWYDLPQIRADIANREAVVKAWEDSSWPLGWSFRDNTATFLAAHPKCQIGIRSEYGEDVPIVDGETGS